MQITKPRTQRKKLFQAPAHRRHKYFSAPLSPELKKKHRANSITVKTGDTVRVMRGDRKGFEGRIISVNRREYKIFVEGVTREKVDGTSIPIPIHPSKVMITNLSLDDKRRREALKRKGVILEEEKLPTTKETASEEKREEPATKKKAKKPAKRKVKRKTEAKTAPEKTRKAEITEKPKQKRTRKARTQKGAE